MILKLGSKGPEVKILQQFLNKTKFKVATTGAGSNGKETENFGPATEAAVKKWQKANGLLDDGIVGRKTWAAMGLATTDLSETIQKEEKLIINTSYLSQGEYLKGPITPRYIFLHHTAGWHNPYNVITAWNRDNRGPIGTEFVIGGQSILGNDTRNDGEVVQSFPHGNWGYHLGAVGSQSMHKNSVGIEVCNFGYLVDNKTYTGAVAHESQIVTLKKAFRKFKTWHKYSDKQITNLRDLLIFIGNRDSIDIREGLPKLIKDQGEKAFEYSANAFSGKIFGVLSHTNVRKDKFDMFPQQELMDMLVSL